MSPFDKEAKEQLQIPKTTEGPSWASCQLLFWATLFGKMSKKIAYIFSFPISLCSHKGVCIQTASLASMFSMRSMLRGKIAQEKEGLGVLFNGLFEFLILQLVHMKCVSLWQSPSNCSLSFVHLSASQIWMTPKQKRAKRLNNRTQRYNRIPNETRGTVVWPSGTKASYGCHRESKQANWLFRPMGFHWKKKNNTD
jgi:hypothetical protein